MLDVSVRTLHYYEEIGLLVPVREANGYRAYLPEDVERLRRILFYRSCGIALSDIKDALDASDSDAHGILVK